MKFDEIYLPDTNIKNIFIEYDRAVITTIDVYEKMRNYKIICTGLAGVTDLNIWDEMCIIDADLKPVGVEDEFVKQCQEKYSWDYDTGLNRKLSNGLILLSIELANFVVFKVYCQDIHIEEYSVE